ncbi:7,8-didemethyl-8-hydroxy-5-deazariboflavin synthase subunit CofG [Archaeoglobales archaeon]|nr:MAG: 7,8-didemethyl-8-hydroxy-5-deazariboflavin synthase subunit CofG [Archaeoglobales archaeon]
MEVVTYSRNVFLPLTNACRNRCAYCGFRSDNPRLMDEKEVLDLLRKARNAKEALFTFGEKPEVYDEIKNKLKTMGYSSFLDYIVAMNKMAIENGFLPHTNAGILDKSELRKLKPYNASMGLMLEQAVELDCHKNSPGKKPEVRLKMIEDAGKLKIPFTTGILVGIGEKEYDREYSIEVIAEIHKNYEHIQEVIIQNFSPKKGTEMENFSPPTIEEMLETVKMARKVLPKDITIQIPPNLVDDLYPFIKAGVRDLGGISDVTPDYINPEHPWPTIQKIERRLKGEVLLRERLPIYPKYVKLGWFGEEIGWLIKKLSDGDGYANSGL